MKTTSNPFASVFPCMVNTLTALTLSLTAPSAFAIKVDPDPPPPPPPSPVVRYWDSNNGTAGFGTAGGTWAAPTVATTTSGWSTNADGTTAISGTSSVTTTTSESTNFGTAAAGLDAGTITVSGTVNSGPMTFGSASGAIELTGGTITMGGKLTVNNATDTISSVLAGVNLVKEGSGTLKLSGANTYTGTTSVSAGVLRLDGATALPGGIGSSGGTSALTLSGGVIGLGTGDFTRGLGTGATQVQWTGSGGFAAYQADRNVNLGGASADVTWGSGNFVPLASSLILGAADATHTVTFQNGINFAGATRTIQVDNGAAAVDAILAGTLSNGDFTKTGLGTLQVTGSITATNAVLNSGSITASGAGGPNTTFASSTITIGGAALTLGASEQIGNTSAVILNSGSFGFGGSGTTETIGTFTNNGGTFATGANTLIGTGATITWAGGTNTISDGGLVQDSHWVITGGTNTVHGGTTGGVLEVQAPGGAGLVFGGTGSPTLTLDSSNSVAGKILLTNDVTVDSSLTSGTAQILTGGALTNPGRIDLNGGTRTFAVNNGSAATDLLISASLTNGGLSKTGTGTLTLTGTNTYSGVTTVTEGTLLLNGSNSGGGQVSVATGATLGGTGSTTAPLTVDGFLSPGISIESLATGDLTFNTGSTFAFEVDSSNVLAPEADFLKATGGLNLNGLVNLTLTDLASTAIQFAPGTTFTLINYVGDRNSGFFTYESTLLSEGATFTAGLNTWKINYGATSGGVNFVSDQVAGGFINLTNLTAIPEPGSLFAVGCFIGSGAFFRSRRRALQ